MGEVGPAGSRSAAGAWHPGPSSRERVGAMMQTDELRRIVESLDREMTRVMAGGGLAGGDPTALLSWWAALVEHLALGPAPELQACPFCGEVGMRAATRCGYCWQRLEPTATTAKA